MRRKDAIGLLWQDTESVARTRALGPVPPIVENGWRPPAEFPTVVDAPWIGIDCETKDLELNDHGPGWARHNGHIVGVSLATSAGKWYFPIRHEVQTELNLDPDTVLRYLRYSLANNQPKIGANILYDIGWLTEEGVTVNGPWYDAQYAEALLDEEAKLSLDQLGWKYLRHGKTSGALQEWAQAYYKKSDARWREDIYRCPVSLVGPYAEDDARMPYDILMQQWPQLTHRGLLDLFFMECKLMKLLLKMRFAGMQIDIPRAERMRDEFAGRAAVAQQEAESMVGMQINVNSGNELALAFDKLGIPYGRTAEGNPSFKQDFLKTVKHPFAEKVQLIRAIDKMRGTFVESYLLNGNVNGKVYCTFHPLMGEDGGAKTGRFSSSDPNLQNIPIRTSEGKLIREAFIMDYGHKQIRTYDYSQIEYRMLLHFAVGPGAEEFRARYWSDPTLDFHKIVGTMITQFTGQELKRSYVKNINFGTIYGVGNNHMAEMLGVELKVAKELLKHYHQALPFSKKTMEAISEQVQRDGICYTILNRQTHFDDWEPIERDRHVTPTNYRAALEQWGDAIHRSWLYKAMNYKLQGSAADIMKKAMVDCDEAGVFDATGVPRLTVHDELVFSDPGDVRDEAWSEMQHRCENAIACKVPIRMDGTSGMNWAQCKD